MSPEAQRIAIAQACGWTGEFIEADGLFAIAPGWKGGEGLGHGGRVEHLVPDYLNDLNAMHEAEKSLGNAAFDFDRQLMDIIKSGTRVCSFDSCAGDFIWHATAAQRAEALLKAIGKWEE